MLAEIGLLAFYVITGTAAVALAAAALNRVSLLAREWADHVRLRERELDLEEGRMMLDRRELDLRERELVLDEQEAAEEGYREDDGDDSPRPHF